MPKYTIRFIGRENGAIGIQYTITDTVEAEDEQAARLKLYDKYEHIHAFHVLNVEDIPESPCPKKDAS